MPALTKLRPNQDARKSRPATPLHRTEGQPTVRPKLRRAEKSQENRKAIIRAAAEVIGLYGYEGASIGRITEKAGLAQGTFYLYFESRQALFDILLPELSLQATHFISEKVHGSRDFFDLEERGFRAFLDWVAHNPSLFRVLNEAEVAAPKAFEKHFHYLVKTYSAALERARSQKQIRGFSKKEIKAIVYMLMGARNYVYLGFAKDQVNGGHAPDWVVRTYMKFVRAALTQPDPAGD